MIICISQIYFINLNLSSWKYQNVLTEDKGSYFNCSVWPIQIEFLKNNLKSRATLYKLTFNSRADSNNLQTEKFRSIIFHTHALL